MLYKFLQDNREEVLTKTEEKTHDLSGVRPMSVQLKAGLPIFYDQLLSVLMVEAKEHKIYKSESDKVHNRNIPKMVRAANENDEVALAQSSGRPDEAELAKSAHDHGKELLRLGYTLSHVVHAYGRCARRSLKLRQKKTFK